jgi:hypothetical protein
MDTYNIIHNRNPYSRKKIDEIIEAFELLDPWRTRYPDERKYTPNIIDLSRRKKKIKKPLHGR